MKDDKVFWYGNDYHNNDDVKPKDYKYIAVIYESNSSYGEIYASNNIKQLKSFVLNSVRKGYLSGSGAIYYSSDEYFDDPIYQVWYNEETGGLQIQNLI